MLSQLSQRHWHFCALLLVSHDGEDVRVLVCAGDVAGEEEVVERHDHRVYCDCGTQAIWSFFEIIVLVAAVTGLLFMAVMIVGMCRGTFLKSREKRLKSEKEKNDKIQQDQVNAVLLKVASGELIVPNRPKAGSKIELPS